MFPAVEGAAQKRPAIINGASRGTEIHARAVLICRKKIDWLAAILIGQDPELVRLHIVSLLRMEK
jgi:hypothetical protein